MHRRQLCRVQAPFEALVIADTGDSVKSYVTGKRVAAM